MLDREFRTLQFQESIDEVHRRHQEKNHQNSLQTKERQNDKLKELRDKAGKDFDVRRKKTR